METKENQLDLLDSVVKYLDKSNQVLPDVAAAKGAVGDAVYKDGALSHKTKRLIAMAIALASGCVPCIIGQTKQAVDEGATKEEVLEAASVLVAIRGSSGFSQTWRVAKVLEELGKM